MVVVENFKGSREIPNSKRDKITIVNALNDSIDIIPIIAAREHLGFYEIRDNIIPRLDRKAYVEGFIDGRLKSFAKKFNEINKVKIKKVKEKTIDIQYSIKAKKWLNKFRGVATKYLDHYLSLRLFEYKNNIFLSEKIKGEFSLKPRNKYIYFLEKYKIKDVVSIEAYKKIFVKFIHNKLKKGFIENLRVDHFFILKVVFL